MTPAETARLLAAAASFDQRTVGRSDVAAWHAALHELDFGDAQQAVIHHYRSTADRIMPVHVLRHVGVVTAERTAAADLAQRSDSHDFEPDATGTVCRSCQLPAANRRHRVIGRDPEENA